MSEIINRVDQFYTGDFAQIMTGVYRPCYKRKSCRNYEEVHLWNLHLYC